MEMDQSQLEGMIREILLSKLGNGSSCGCYQKTNAGVIGVKVPLVKVTQADRMDTSVPTDEVYTKDLFSLQESPRLGCGIMEMKQTTFDWTLNYDEIDYVIEGTLSILINGQCVTANAGELILIPKGSSIKFSVPEYARFIYVTYPADWASQ